ncbi:hypothetical protein [Allosphingosinicella deserti]|uniref:Uncharacterized protein n=1 Tax=Allosphingosinicella deserti TaxID=2116704 RepID=A0A2P7QEU3_9SPHN|nr:hypothetical protein [Sphingomonas deserti]PSJ36489.1 hypothetical protein C7I55_25800 [Sphingomonas deserti]
MTRADAPEILNEAIPLYLGYGFLAEPEPDLTRVADHFGGEEAWRLRPSLEALISEVDHIRPKLDAQTAEANDDWVMSFIRAEFPFLDETGRGALAWFWQSRNT